MGRTVSTSWSLLEITRLLSSHLESKAGEDDDYSRYHVSYFLKRKRCNHHLGGTFMGLKPLLLQFIFLC